MVNGFFCKKSSVIEKVCFSVHIFFKQICNFGAKHFKHFFSNFPVQTQGSSKGKFFKRVSTIFRKSPQSPTKNLFLQHNFINFGQSTWSDFFNLNVFAKGFFFQMMMLGFWKRLKIHFLSQFKKKFSWLQHLTPTVLKRGFFPKNLRFLKKTRPSVFLRKFIVFAQNARSNLFEISQLTKATEEFCKRIFYSKILDFWKIRKKTCKIANFCIFSWIIDAFFHTKK